jgi:hypothetical protein
VILPALPVPVMDAGAIFSSNIFWLLEMAFLKRKLLLELPEPLWSGSGLLSSTFVLVFVTLRVHHLRVLLVCINMATPTATASPSSALRVIIPLASAGNSNVALSESTTAIAPPFSIFFTLTTLQFQLLY